MRNRYLVLGLASFMAIALSVPALGGPSNPIAQTAASTKSTANKALKKAKAAQSAADSAQSTATAAQSTASQALTKANSLDATKFDTIAETIGTASPSNNADKAIVEAVCPGAGRATGGGYSLAGDAGPPVATDDAVVLLNFGYGTEGWVVQADDRNTLAGNWSVTPSVQRATP